MSASSLKFIRLSISLIALSFFLCSGVAAPMGEAIVDIIRKQVITNGFVPAATLYRNNDEALVSVGKDIFASTKLSLNGNISCITCHQDKFNSEDGVPNAAAVGGHGVGVVRMESGARLLPRKALPLWGRGAKGFNTFFWDGRVSYQAGRIVSQFGSAVPSQDVLVTAEHLPVVEIREMLDDGDQAIASRKLESVEEAQVVYQAIAKRLVRGEPQASARLATFLHKNIAQLTYTDFARSLAAFIRFKFRIKQTRLEQFAYDKGSLNEDELRGALVFYGNGKCITCHSGPYFSDFGFHTVAVPELGFGKNGFGIDYGRYNATFDTHDLYRFRTPPLFNVAKNSYFTHSGGVATLHDAVVAHFDPLSLVDLQKMTPLQRNDLYRRLTFSQETAARVGFLTPADVDNLVAFMKTLSF
jgi:cytochrome c peroxidase